MNQCRLVGETESNHSEWWALASPTKTKTALSSTDWTPAHGDDHKMYHRALGYGKMHKHKNCLSYCKYKTHNNRGKNTPIGSAGMNGIFPLHQEPRCGTWHMASLFTPLSRTAITTIFSEAVLQTCQHQLPQALATSLLYTSSSCPSSRLSFTQLLALLLPSLMHFSQLPCLYQVHSLQLSYNEVSSLLLLGKPPGNFGTDYYAKNQLLARNSTSNTQRTTPKVLAPDLSDKQTRWMEGNHWVP